jgi:tRNA pseudouridine13 synthase
MDAVRRVAGMLGVDARDVGYAGMKDRHATTRQWISVPRVEPEIALQIAGVDLQVLAARRHGNKLRIGHLRGNRFEMVLTGNVGDGDDALAKLLARLGELAAGGLANRFGDQRFGMSGDNAAEGLAILRGQRRERDHRRRKLLLSAAQSAVFNRYLELRATSGRLTEVRLGDVLQKTDTGGMFVCEDAAADQARVDAGGVVPTGPMPGGRVMEPPPATPSRALEDQALADSGATREDFDRAGRDLPGARRPVVVAVEMGDPPLTAEPAGEGLTPAVRLRFALPAGSYATVVLAALLC